MARGVYYLGGIVFGVGGSACSFCFAFSFICVGCMGDSDSESDFELHAVHSLHDGLSDSPSHVLHNSLDDVAEILEEANTKHVSASE